MESETDMLVAHVRVELPNDEGEPPKVDTVRVVRPADPSRSDPVTAAGRSSDLLAATTFLAWGFETLAELLEEGGEVAEALLKIAASREVAAAFAAKREEEEGTYDPELYMPTIAERFYGGGRHHASR